MRMKRPGVPGMVRKAGRPWGTGMNPREGLPFLLRSRAATYSALFTRWGKGCRLSTIWGESTGRIFTL